MKSKITLIILLVLLVISIATSGIFVGKYMKLKNNPVSATNQEASIESQRDNETEVKTELVEVEKEKLSIAKVDPEKIDPSTLESVTNVKEARPEIVTYDDVRILVGGGSDHHIEFTHGGKNMTLSPTEFVVDVKQGSVGVNGAYYIMVLMSDGTIQYAKKVYQEFGLEFKTYPLENVVRLVNVSYGTPSGREITNVAAITSDGVTHIIPVGFDDHN